MTGTCKACATRTKMLGDEDRECAFPNGGPFTPKNSHCATMEKLRNRVLRYVEEHPYVSTRKNLAFHFFNDDQRTVLVDLSQMMAFGARSLWMSWYKHRAFVDSAWLLHDRHEPRRPTEDDILQILERALSPGGYRETWPDGDGYDDPPAVQSL